MNAATLPVTRGATVKPAIRRYATMIINVTGGYHAEQGQKAKDSFESYGKHVYSPLKLKLIVFSIAQKTS
jgi:hypothetical protein